MNATIWSELSRRQVGEQRAAILSAYLVTSSYRARAMVCIMLVPVKRGKICGVLRMCISSQQSCCVRKLTACTKLKVSTISALLVLVQRSGKELGALQQRQDRHCMWHMLCGGTVFDGYHCFLFTDAQYLNGTRNS